MGQQQTLIVQGKATYNYTHSNTTGDNKKHSHTLQYFRVQRETLTHTQTLQGTTRNTHTQSHSAGDSNRQSHAFQRYRGQQAGSTQAWALRLAGRQAYMPHLCSYCPHNLSVLAHNHAGYQLLSPVLILSSRILAAFHLRLKEPNELLVVQNNERKTKEGPTKRRAMKLERHVDATVTSVPVRQKLSAETARASLRFQGTASERTVQA